MNYTTTGLFKGKIKELKGFILEYYNRYEKKTFYYFS